MAGEIQERRVLLPGSRAGLCVSGGWLCAGVTVPGTCRSSPSSSAAYCHSVDPGNCLRPQSLHSPQIVEPWKSAQFTQSEEFSSEPTMPLRLNNHSLHSSQRGQTQVCRKWDSCSSCKMLSELLQSLGCTKRFQEPIRFWTVACVVPSAKNSLLLALGMTGSFFPIHISGSASPL